MSICATLCHCMSFKTIFWPLCANFCTLACQKYLRWQNTLCESLQAIASSSQRCLSISDSEKGKSAWLISFAMKSSEVCPEIAIIWCDMFSWEKEKSSGEVNWNEIFLFSGENAINLLGSIHSALPCYLDLFRQLLNSHCETCPFIKSGGCKYLHSRKHSSHQRCMAQICRVLLDT